MLPLTGSSLLCKLCSMNVRGLEAHAVRQCRWQALQLPSTSHAVYKVVPPLGAFTRRADSSAAALLHGTLGVRSGAEGSGRKLVQPLFASDCQMYSRFQRFVSRILQDRRPQAKVQRQQNAHRDLSCHAVAVDRRLDELKSRAVGGEGPNGMPLPDPIHAVLTPQEVAGRRIILVGDVHGKPM